MSEAVPLSSMSRRNRQPAAAARSASPEPEDFTSTPQLPPVSRAKQAGVMASAFVAICLTIGYNQCYGVFQEYYLSPAQDVLSPAPASAADPPTAVLAFVGTLAAGLTWSGSLFVNPLISRIEYSVHLAATGALPSASGTRAASSGKSWRRRLSARGVTLAGVALMSLGFVLASFSTRVWQLLLTQGLLYGAGSSMLYFPLLNPAPEYFAKHRATALGLILSGAGIGGLVLSPIIRALLSAVGGRWTLRIMAVLYALVGTPVAWTVPPSRFPVVTVPGEQQQQQHQQQQHQTRRRTRLSSALLANPAFVLSTAAAFCQSAGAQLPLTFIPSYSVALGLSAGSGATLLAASNAINAVARVVSGYAGDRLGRLNALVVSLVVATVAVGALWGMSVRGSPAGAAAALSDSDSGSDSVKLWISFIILYSTATGGYSALFPATIADVFGIRSYAAVNGFIYFIRGCGTMLGSPVGGALLGKQQGGPAGGRGYGEVVVWDGALLAGSAVCILGVRWADAIRRGWAWRA